MMPEKSSRDLSGAEILNQLYMFRDDFNTFDDSRWIKGYWWQDDRVPFHPTVRREWFNRENISIVESNLSLALKNQPRTFDYLTYLYACLNATQDPKEQLRLIDLIKTYKPNPYIKINYSAGVVCSKQLYGHGYYEAQIYQDTEGTWNAFWLYGEGKDPSEIDIMEQTSLKLSEYCTNAHISFKNCFGRTIRKQNEKDIKRNIAGWHTYALEWSVKKLEFYFDGMLQRTIKSRAKWVTCPQREIFNTACWSGQDSALKIDHFYYEPF
jgi:hypothetical protein